MQAAITADKVHVVNVTRSANLQVTSGEVLRVPTLEVLAKITGDNINIRTTELRVVGSIVGETSVTISDDSFSASDALSPCNHGDDLECVHSCNRLVCAALQLTIHTGIAIYHQVRIGGVNLRHWL